MLATAGGSSANDDILVVVTVRADATDSCVQSASRSSDFSQKYAIGIWLITIVSSIMFEEFKLKSNECSQ